VTACYGILIGGLAAIFLVAWLLALVDRSVQAGWPALIPVIAWATWILCLVTVLVSLPVGLIAGWVGADEIHAISNTVFAWAFWPTVVGWFGCGLLDTALGARDDAA
jgi:hypothetical protein